MTQHNSSPTGSTRRPGRPPGRSAYQEEQRRKTRAAILAAAAEIFAAKPYVHATIDDIIGAAGISRATFYVHFESKVALAIAIYDGIAADWLGHFDRLASMVPLRIGLVKQWIVELADLYVSHGFVTPLTEQLALFEQSFRDRSSRDRDEVIERMAQAGVPGFMAAIGDGADTLLQRTRMRLLLLRLNQVCGIVSHQDSTAAEELDAYVKIMAEDMCELLA